MHTLIKPQLGDWRTRQLQQWWQKVCKHEANTQGATVLDKDNYLKPKANMPGGASTADSSKCTLSNGKDMSETVSERGIRSGTLHASALRLPCSV